VDPKEPIGRSRSVVASLLYTAGLLLVAADLGATAYAFVRGDQGAWFDPAGALLAWWVTAGLAWRLGMSPRAFFGNIRVGIRRTPVGGG
jgi:hypothetical protein